MELIDLPKDVMDRTERILQKKTIELSTPGEVEIKWAWEEDALNLSIVCKCNKGDVQVDKCVTYGELTCFKDTECFINVNLALMEHRLNTYAEENPHLHY